MVAAANCGVEGSVFEVARAGAGFFTGAGFLASTDLVGAAFAAVALTAVVLAGGCFVATDLAGDCFVAEVLAGACLAAVCLAAFA